MTALRLATAPVSWGIWEQTIDRPDLVPPRPLLETVTAMGYRALETGPPGYLAADGASAAALADAFDVDFVATFLPLRLDDERGYEDDLRALDRTTEVLAATGGGLVLLADAERPHRAAISGRPEQIIQNGLSDRELDRAAERLDHAASRCACKRCVTSSKTTTNPVSAPGGSGAPRSSSTWVPSRASRSTCCSHSRLSIAVKAERMACESGTSDGSSASHAPSSRPMSGVQSSPRIS